MRSPGAQKRTLRLDKLSTILVIIILLGLAIVIQSVLHANYSASSDYFLVKLKILDIDKSFTILAGLIGVYVTKEGITLAFKPYLIYSFDSKRIRKKEWKTIQIHNKGNGIAIIKGIHVKIEPQPLPAEYLLVENKLKFEQMLRKYNLQPERDFKFSFLAHGSAISSKEQFILFEYNEEFSGIEKIDFKIEFKGMLGEIYYKEIFCIRN